MTNCWVVPYSCNPLDGKVADGVEKIDMIFLSTECNVEV